jgi:hypothetical protein
MKDAKSAAQMAPQETGDSETGERECQRGQPQAAAPPPDA